MGGIRKAVLQHRIHRELLQHARGTVWAPGLSVGDPGLLKLVVGSQPLQRSTRAGVR